jgi:hypothetical protein
LILCEASRADALPAEERALSDRDERRGGHDDEPSFERPSPQAWSGRRSRFRACSRDRRGARVDLRRKASSILLLDEETEELVFEAVVGEGEDTLLGTRFPAGTGSPAGSSRRERRS